MKRLKFKQVRNLALVAIGLAAQPAFGIYISPYNAGNAANQAAARRIATSVWPTAGGVTNDVGNRCTGTLVATTVKSTAAQVANDPWILTAGHCGGNLADNGFIYRPTGYYVGNDPANGLISSVASDRVRRHPTFAFPTDDVMVYRLNPANAGQWTQVTGAGQSDLFRVAAGTAPVNGLSLTAVGVGTSNAVGGWAGGVGDKRQFVETVNNQAAGGNGYQYGVGGGVVANPTRHICSGDSGGPSFTASGFVTGTHRGTIGETADCDGTATGNRDANVTLPYLYNYVDTYTQKSIFWDQLEIRAAGGGLLDSDDFDVAANASYGLTFSNPANIAKNWQLANDGSVTHPNGAINTINANTDWRYISAIGTGPAAAANLFTDGDEALGEIMLGGGPSLVKKEFSIVGGQVVTLTVKQRWNSLGLADDVGIRLPNGDFLWNGLINSTETNLDSWLNRSQVIDLSAYAGLQTITVYLLNVPEPTTAGLMLMAGLIGLRLRRRVA